MWLLYVIAAVLLAAVAIAVWDARWRASPARTRDPAGDAAAEPTAEEYDAKRVAAAKAAQRVELDLKKRA